jgi:hypothetical protein
VGEPRAGQAEGRSPGRLARSEQRPCAAREGAAHLKAAASSWWDQVVLGDQPGQNQLGPADIQRSSPAALAHLVVLLSRCV